MYRVEPDETVEEQLDDLPYDALLGYAEALGVMEIDPWAGRPVNDRNPGGAVRQLAFGPDRKGLVTYLILERDRQVDVISVIWLG